MADNQPGLDASRWEFWVGILFWFVILGGGALSFFHEDRADVLFNVATQTELISGTVNFGGEPVRGVVRIEVVEALNRRYRGGTTMEVESNGTFSSHGQPSLGIEKDKTALRILAMFHGTHGEKDKAKPLAGEATIYLNSAPPLGEGFLKGVAIIFLSLLAIQLFLFTGDLGPRKARWLFVLMYFFTFFSIALPIAVSLIVAQNPYLVVAMQNSPIGLVKAKTPVLKEAQWLINIGGTVSRDISPVPASRVIGPQPGEPPASAEPTSAEPTSASAPAKAPPATPDADNDPRFKIEGGIAVPFFVVLLSMFGAGINMTLKVPEIQRNYEDVLPEANVVSSWFNPVVATWRFFTRGSSPALGTPVSRKTAADIRRDLIENYMYLISAPLLAIAMYYLLQVLAEQVTLPVLVVMALATGLVSKAVIKKIILFAEKYLEKEPPGTSTPDAEAAVELHAKAAEATTRQDDSAAANRVLNEARNRQAAADAVAKETAEMARKAKDKEKKVQAELGTSQATPAQAQAAKQEADDATKKAGEKQAAADAAAKEVERLTQEAQQKRSEMEAAVGELQRTAARQAVELSKAAASAAKNVEEKQSAAKVAAVATEEAAKTATEKQDDAQAAMQTAVRPALAAEEDAKQLAASVDKSAQTASDQAAQTASDKLAEIASHVTAESTLPPQATLPPGEKKDG